MFWRILKSRYTPAAGSALFHCLILWLMCLVPLASTVVERVDEIRGSQQSLRFQDDNPQQVNQEGQQPYGKMADMRSLDPVAMPEVPCQTVTSASVPAGTDMPVPSVPVPVARTLPPSQLPYVPAREVATIPQPQEPERPSRVRPPELVEVKPEPAEPPRALETPQEKPLDRPVAQARQEPAAAPAATLEMPRRGPQIKPDRPAAIELKPAQPAQAEPVQVARLMNERRQPARVVEAVQDREKVEVTVGADPAGKKTADPEAALVSVAKRERAEAPGVGTPGSPPAPGRPVAVSNVLDKDKLVVGSLANQSKDAPPSFSPLGNRLARVPASAIARADDNAGNRAMFILREGEVRKQSIEVFGGTKGSEAAVERGLDWLAAHQNANGSWSLNNFNANCKHPKCGDVGSFNSDPAGTGLALLPFLGAGYTHKAGKHQQTVARALKWLADQQKADGGLLAAGDPRPLYGYGLAAIALCEAYGMTQDPNLKALAQKALDFIAKAQHGPSGGWRYQPNTPGDTSVLGWQVMALKSGEMAGLSVPPQRFEGARRWLRSVEANLPAGGLFGYQAATPTPAMTAQGLLCLQLMGTRRNDSRLQAGADYLLKHLPQPGDTSYYWYHATQVMYHMQGKYWQSWNARLRDGLVAAQLTQGALAGSWTPVDAREKAGGRICSTALRLLMLEVYYRHLPLYQQLEK